MCETGQARLALRIRDSSDFSGSYRRVRVPVGSTCVGESLDRYFTELRNPNTARLMRLLEVVEGFGGSVGHH